LGAATAFALSDFFGFLLRATALLKCTSSRRATAA
jgi:hypothetical protein